MTFVSAMVISAQRCLVLVSKRLVARSLRKCAAARMEHWALCFTIVIFAMASNTGSGFCVSGLVIQIGQRMM